MKETKASRGLTVGLVAGTLCLLGLAVFVAVAGSAAWAPSWVHDIQVIQRDLHRQLADAIRAVKQQEAVAAWGLIGLSFLYGIFHAAGPGHGKMVISTYLVTHESRLGRGLTLSVLSSLVQGVTAVVTVELTVAVLGLTLADARAASSHLEAASYGLVVLIGLILAYSGLRRLIHRRSAHDHGESGAACGHSHGPTAAHLEHPVKASSLAAIVGSIGVRPCSGSILVLLFAHVLDVHWIGIAAVIAISAGTAITVSLLAVLSVYARKGMVRLAAHYPSGAGVAAVVFDILTLGGGIVILLLGAALLHGALDIVKHPLMQ